MSAIFISYRREDTEGHAGRLFEALKAHFGPDAVFMDVAGIKPGRDFRRAIDSNVANCDALLAVIGKGWLSAKDATGQRRLDDANDFVRLETISALKRDIPVVPVLVQAAVMPRKEQLPPEMEELAYRNAVELTHARWASDVQVLIQALEEIVKKPDVPAGPAPVLESVAPADLKQPQSKSASTSPSPLQNAPQNTQKPAEPTPAEPRPVQGLADPVDASTGRVPSFKWAVIALAAAGVSWGGYETYQRSAEKERAAVQMAEQKVALAKQEETRQADLAIAQANALRAQQAAEKEAALKEAAAQRDKVEKAAKDEALRREADLKAQDDKSRQLAQTQAQLAQARAEAERLLKLNKAQPQPQPQPQAPNQAQPQPPQKKSEPSPPVIAGATIQSLVVPFAVGGASDNLARMLADTLKSPIQGEIQIENKPGTSGDQGAQAVARSTADGKTLLFTADAVITINPGLYKRTASFDPAKELEALALIAYVPSVLVVPESSPVKSVADLVVRARQRPLNYASAGIGTFAHLVMASFEEFAKLKLQHTPYKGSAPALAALTDGQAEVAFATLPAVLALVKSGKLRALAVSTNQRLAQLPDVPTVIESGFANFDRRGAYMVLAPANTPADVKAALANRISAALQRPDFQARLAEQGLIPARVTGKPANDWAAGYRNFWTSFMQRNNISAAQ